MQIFKIVVTSLLLAFSISSQAIEIEEGVHYEVVNTLPSDGKFVSVYFNYGCPGCFKAESLVKFVADGVPEGVKVSHVPFENHPGWRIYVQAFYIAEMLEMSEKAHTAIFHRVHVEKKQIGDLEQLKAFFVDLGADGKRFDAAAKSFQLDAKQRLARKQAMANKILSTPTFVVNDRFRVNANAFKSNAELLEGINQLLNM
ncbi:thiol:disulfide interchange protein DsbA/DsbL [Pleionea litopenaei]|uniref:Thiol:disulfide interchange protein n=1 Tax=Pleionea litopenaei TaxID=3070815 RepID=A0AA51RR68_9GAMM|nr:thiol:disulfide interchange protein DsbA/DsbL [Pleionea sp. HL-JVS1]WMS86009.1 thiol:disulfide interchange protein DsbA/DsbL [Pleionea sp. HL-JVS1]